MPVTRTRPHLINTSNWAFVAYKLSNRINPTLMRIGLVSYEYPPQSGLGGVGSYTIRLAAALGAAGHQVVVLCGPNLGQPETPLPNVRVHRIPARFDPPLKLSALR